MPAETCGVCGSATRTESKFCPSCGSTLGAVAPSADVDASPGRSRRRLPPRGVLIAAFAIVLVVGLVSAVLIATSGDDDTTTATPKGQELYLEAAASTGDAPFTDSLGPAASFVPTPVEVAPTASAATPGAVLAVAAATPGLYGGTTTESCDPKALAAFLAADAKKAAAFAAASGITIDGIDSYIGGLRPVVLSRDTRVTNHGYRNGAATAFQAVLQRGTAVLVDDTGTPRVRCKCGNPLGPPKAITPIVVGEPWPDFDADALISVVPAPEPITELAVQTPDGLTQVHVGTLSIRDIDFANMTYPNRRCSLEGDTVTLVDGQADRVGPLEFAADASWIKLLEPRFIDVDDDGVEEAIVMLECGFSFPQVTEVLVYSMNEGELIVVSDVADPGEFSRVRRWTGPTTFEAERDDHHGYGYGSTIDGIGGLLVDSYEINVVGATLRRTSRLTLRLTGSLSDPSEAQAPRLDRLKAICGPVMETSNWKQELDSRKSIFVIRSAGGEISLFDVSAASGDPLTAPVLAGKPIEWGPAFDAPPATADRVLLYEFERFHYEGPAESTTVCSELEL